MHLMAPWAPLGERLPQQQVWDLSLGCPFSEGTSAVRGPALGDKVKAQSRGRATRVVSETRGRDCHNRCRALVGWGSLLLASRHKGEECQSPGVGGGMGFRHSPLPPQEGRKCRLSHTTGLHGDEGRLWGAGDEQVCNADRQTARQTERQTDRRWSSRQARPRSQHMSLSGASW